MSTAWNDLINQAFIDLAVIQPGETITGSMQTDAQTRLNQLIGSLNTEGATVFQQVLQSFALSPGVVAYTLGSGGSFATTGGLRAQKVTAWRASYGGVLMAGGKPLSMEEFGAVAQQNAGEVSAIPKAVGADTSFPLINVRVFPPPSNTPGNLELAYWTPIAQITDFTVSPTLPDGWFDMLHFNLAVRLYPQYARQGGIPPELAANAQNTKAALVQQNAMAVAPQAVQQ